MTRCSFTVFCFTDSTAHVRGRWKHWERLQSPKGWKTQCVHSVSAGMCNLCKRRTRMFRLTPQSSWKLYNEEEHSERRKTTWAGERKVWRHCKGMWKPVPLLKGSLVQQCTWEASVDPLRSVIFRICLWQCQVLQMSLPSRTWGTDTIVSSTNA